MRMLLRLAAATVAAAFALPAVAASAAAVENESFGIAPFPEQVDGLDRLTFAIPLEPGAVFEDAVRVYNRTDQPIELIVYAADARAGVDGTISVDLRGSRPEGVGAWIELAEDQLSLPPRGEAFVNFRITVRSADPLPDFGAVVVENNAPGSATDRPQRLHVVVRTSPTDSPTTSRRVRSLLLRSPWIIVAVLGLVTAAVLVWLGTRRTRRQHDAITPPGELTEAPAEAKPEPSKPVLHRLGDERRRSPKGATVLTETPDDRPLLDLPEGNSDDLDEDEEPMDTSDEIAIGVSPARIARYDDDEEDLDLDEDEEPVPPPPRRPSRARGDEAPAPPKRAETKRGYIPLDEL